MAFVAGLTLQDEVIMITKGKKAEFYEVWKIRLFILQHLLVCFTYTVYIRGPAVFKEPYIVVLICI